MKTRLGKKGLALLLIASFLLVLFPYPTADAAMTNNFYNVLVQNGADPSVYRHTDGYYYSTYTTGGDVRLWRHRSLLGMDAGESVSIWKGCCAVWAPEIAHIDGVWYIYFSKGTENTTTTQRMFVLSNPNKDPFTGSWTLTRLYDPANDYWAIDHTVLENNGQLYLIYSGWANATNQDQNLYIAPMSSPTKVSGNRVRIAYPQYSWETNTTPRVNEGPEVIVRNGKINIVYSGSGSWTDTYALGLITASTDSDLLNPASWTKKSTPIFQSGNGIYGPGHHSFTKSPDGIEDWIVYHSARWSGAGWTRAIRTQKFTWNADNTPNLGTPAAPNTPIAIPSGEMPRDRYEAEHARLGGGARVIYHTSASNGAKVGYIDNPGDYLEFTVNVPVAGYYILVARTDNGTSNRDWAILNMSVNGGPNQNFYVAYSGWDNWTNATAKVYLNAGDNTIRYTHNTNFAEVDCIDIMYESPVESGKLLDVAGGGTAEGSNVQIWKDTFTGAQHWKPIKTTP
ncbi:family 43 glycosylhydrolase [Desmospora activa]|uniref:GH43 family beta-xylosidase n=1 Tax=Desmospora activa DSM 45169 TaxID=1121389 RepID=A0A2T4Z9A9_9BACL|nr:family 43 glycosylhydrolase [Desmospora activa]PTM58457.1 GH43 family beta-xylosidase [Desmospora activa DSM 45169]